MNKLVWPLILFDSDGVPYGCINDVVAGGFIEDYPEEFVAAFDSTGAPIEVIGQGNDIDFRITGRPRCAAEVLSRITSYAIESGIDAEALTAGGLQSAIENLIEYDASREFAKRLARGLSALRPRKRRTT